MSKKDGSTWEYVYFLDEIGFHDYPMEELNKAVGYAPHNVVQGFNVLDDEKSCAILARFELESTVYYPPVTQSEYFDVLETMDVSATAYRRKEQGFLRHVLFGHKATGTCCICGSTFPVGLLVAAHIKKRADCTLLERKDFKNIVAPMCKLGCDDLFERGFIAVSDGCVLDTKVGNRTQALLDRMKPLIGRRCGAWTQGTKRYFDWHKENHESSSLSALS